jgi:hypothetical protein
MVRIVLQFFIPCRQGDSLSLKILKWNKYFPNNFASACPSLKYPLSCSRLSTQPKSCTFACVCLVDYVPTELLRQHALLGNLSRAERTALGEMRKVKDASWRLEKRHFSVPGGFAARDACSHWYSREIALYASGRSR